MTLIGLDGKYLLTGFPKKMQGEEEDEEEMKEEGMAISPWSAMLLISWV